jgi:hypothetical protein
MTTSRTTSSLKLLALLVGAAMLATGSAYAGATIAKNSVGSPQVINGSLRHQDVRDGTLRTQELAPGAAPKTYTFIRNIPEGQTEALNIPGFSRFTFSCSGTGIGLLVSFGDETPEDTDPWQQHGIAGSDIADNNPVGGATITGWGGGVGFGTGGGASPGSGILVRGDYWGRATRLLACVSRWWWTG